MDEINNILNSIIDSLVLTVSAITCSIKSAIHRIRDIYRFQLWITNWYRLLTCP